MNGFVGSLRLGWNALFFKEDAYEQMRTSANPVVKGLVLIVVVGVVIALCNLVGTGIELASTPSMSAIKDTIYSYLRQMPWYEQLAQQGPGFVQEFERNYNLGWSIFPRLFGAPDVGSAAAGILFTPLSLVIRWLIYGLLAYMFARWLGGTANLSETLGVLALAVAPQILNVFKLLPFVEVGSLAAVWGLLVTYMGLKTAHKLSWARAVWATLLPYLLVVAVLVLFGCLSTAFLGAVTGGRS
jgi:hypothetical protein